METDFGDAKLKREWASVCLGCDKLEMTAAGNVKFSAYNDLEAL